MCRIWHLPLVYPVNWIRSGHLSWHHTMSWHRTWHRSMPKWRPRRNAKLMATKRLSPCTKMWITSNGRTPYKWRAWRIRSSNELRSTPWRWAKRNWSIIRRTSWIWWRWKTWRLWRSWTGSRGTWRCRRSSILWSTWPRWRSTRVRRSSSRGTRPCWRPLKRRALIPRVWSWKVLPWIRSKALGLRGWPLPSRSRVLQCGWQRDWWCYTAATAWKEKSWSNLQQILLFFASFFIT